MNDYPPITNRIREPTPHPQRKLRILANQGQASVTTAILSPPASIVFPRTTTRQVGKTATVSVPLPFRLPHDNVGLPIDPGQRDTVAEHMSLFPEEFAPPLRNS